MISTLEEHGKKWNPKKLGEFITENEIERYYVLDREGKNLGEDAENDRSSPILTAMFATIFAAAETSFYEMGAEDEVIVRLETPGSGHVLVFGLDETTIIALAVNKDSHMIQCTIKELKWMIHEYVAASAI